MPMTEQRESQHEADVTASELAAFAYCAKAWHLERVLGARASSAVYRRRDAGIDDHIRHGRSVRVGSWLARNSKVFVAALVLITLLFAVLAITVG